jgi:branched-chain amino acid transport system substrate-binding protein
VQETLGPTRVAVVDDGSAYGLPLADSIGRRLGAAGAAVSQASVDPELTDFTSVLASIRAVDAVVLAWQSPAQAQVFAEQFRALNKRAAIVGTDALEAEAFTLEGTYFAAPLPDVRAFAQNARLLERFRRRYGTFTTLLGPPAYAAAQAAILAVRNACRDGRASRAEVARWLGRTFVPGSILGSTIAFTDRGDVRGARFSIFRIENGVKKLVQRRINK